MNWKHIPTAIPLENDLPADNQMVVWICAEKEFHQGKFIKKHEMMGGAPGLKGTFKSATGIGFNIWNKSPRREVLAWMPYKEFTDFILSTDINL